ncbi:MAG: hypothetical protein AABX89_05070 [Candidatus Thermoplasmatota archaeon]
MARPFLNETLAGTAVVLVLAGLAAAAPSLPEPLGTFAWGSAHRAAALPAVVLPALLFLVHAVAVPRMPRPVSTDVRCSALLLGGALLLTTSALANASRFVPMLFALGQTLVAVALFLALRGILRALPGRKESVVSVAEPLTKGDDASLKQVRFGMVALTAGLVLQAVLAITAATIQLEWLSGPGPQLAATHLLLVGGGLPLLYGLSHIIVPRLSGVPAIAAGAIKGELHSTLLGVLLLVFGFLFGIKGLLIAGGLSTFFGAFVFMGVLGANIMKNKSKTQRVTPGFAYIPWVFSGVLWIVVGVLLGLFLNIVPDIFADRLPALRSIHAHLLLFGGLLQLALGFAARTLVAEPIPFSRHRWSFHALNVALGLHAWGALSGSSPILAGSAALALLGLAAWFFPLRRPSALVSP